MSSIIKLLLETRPWNAMVVTCVMSLATFRHLIANFHRCPELNTTLAIGLNAVTIYLKVFSFNFFFCVTLLSIRVRWYAISVCNARFFKNSHWRTKREKGTKSWRLTYSGRCVLWPSYSFLLSISVFAIFVLRFFIPDFCSSLAILVPTMSTENLTKHTPPHTKRTITHTKKKRSRRLSCLSDAGPTPTCLWRTVNSPTSAPECWGSRWGGKPVWGFVVCR